MASGVIASHAVDPLPASAQPASDSVSTAREAVPIMTYIEVGLFAGEGAQTAGQASLLALWPPGSNMSRLNCGAGCTQAQHTSGGNFQQ